MRLTILRSGALGDLLLLRPCLWRLRELLPGVKILFIAPGERGRLAGEGWADSVLDLDRADAAWLFGGASGPPAGLAAALEGTGQAIVYGRESEALRGNLMALGVDEVCFHPANPDPRGGLHATVHLWTGLAQFFGLPVQPMGIFNHIPPFSGDPSAADECLVNAGLDGKRFCLMHPGSGSSRKNMPLRLFENAGRILVSGADRPGMLAGFGVVSRIAISAGEADGTLGEDLARMTPCATLLPSVNLAVLAGILRRSAGYIGNDSGVSHLAGQCGVRTVAFFRVTDPEVWRPVGPFVHAVDSGEFRAALSDNDGSDGRSRLGPVQE